MDMAAMRQQRRTQGGFTLIEVLIALIIAIGIAVIAAEWMQRSQRQQDNANAGEWLRIVAGAARSYERANRAALTAAAGPTTPVTVTPTQLAPYMPAGFSATNAYGQTFTVRFIEPTAGQLDGMVMTTGGDTLDGLNLVQVANAAGGGGGYIDPANAANARGPQGNWVRALAAFGGGTGSGKNVYALFYDAAAALDGGAPGDFLSREAVAGQPELNRMSTAIDMANNNINNAGQIGANGLIASTTGVRANAIAIGSGVYGAVPYGAETIQIPTGANLRFYNGTTERMVIGSGSTVIRGDTQMTGNLAVNEVTANGWVRTQGQAGWYSQTYGGGFYMTDANWIRAYNNKGIYTAGEIRGKTLRSEERLAVGEYIQLDGVAAEGGSCSGRVMSMDASGGLLSCQSSKWTAAAGPGIAKAWVNFNGAACSPMCTIRSSYNVASVQRIATGDYIITLATPMLDAASVVQATAAWSLSAQSFNFITAYATSTQQIRAYVTEAHSSTSYWAKTNVETMSVTVHR